MARIVNQGPDDSQFVHQPVKDGTTYFEIAVDGVHANRIANLLVGLAPEISTLLQDGHRVNAMDVATITTILQANGVTISPGALRWIMIGSMFLST